MTALNQEHEVAASPFVVSSAQKDALMAAVKFLDAIGGEGIGHQFADGTRLYGDEVIFDLFRAFLPDYDGDVDYPTALLAHLQSKEQSAS